MGWAGRRNGVPVGDMTKARVDHVGIWARDLERLREFYVSALQGESGPAYVNERTGLVRTS